GRRSLRFRHLGSGLLGRLTAVGGGGSRVGLLGGGAAVFAGDSVCADLILSLRTAATASAATASSAAPAGSAIGGFLGGILLTRCSWRCRHGIRDGGGKSLRLGGRLRAASLRRSTVLRFRSLASSALGALLTLLLYAVTLRARTVMA